MAEQFTGQAMTGSGRKDKAERESGRKERLAAALRANLARRRQQKQGRATDEPGEEKAAPRSPKSPNSDK